MDNKLVPAHIHFAKWFIRIRWIAISILIVATLAVKHLLDISIQELSIYILSFILLALNVLHRILLQRIKKEGSGRIIQKIKHEIHFQIITDLIILTLILHYSGGIENPLFLFYFFHMIIASSIFSTLQSYTYALITIILAASLALLECYAIIPHYPLENFVSHDLYKNILYVYGTGFVFACTSILVVFLSHMIIYRSIKSEETYAKTNFELENKDKVKNEYVLRVTHDIKGHVAAISSCIDVIRTKVAGPLTGVQEEFANRAFERTELLSGFVKNLLNLTKKRLRLDNESEEFSLKELINKAVTPVQILAKDKSIDFNVYVDKSIQMFTGNPFTIEELYSNLLLNAVKYTPPHGHIELSVKNRLNHIVTEISDSGIGIPKEELSKVFDEFYRATNVPKDIKTGSGLGLSIVKQIVENHNGKIWISSELGVWTKFTFVLPKNPTTT
ncbi:MAG TPA: HAMP domain-containing sensor histidine kinase [Bacteroidales bacterium]|nr:HAMP domain-containing sensor histidine kinase [Bacteroidales bacterium]